MPSAVVIQDLSYAYPAEHTSDEPHWVLRHVDLQVMEGECLSIMGPSGSGKSTLCLALNGIVPHSTGGTIGGNVTVFGSNTKELTVARLAREVGLVFQEPESQLLAASAELEVAFGLESLAMSREALYRRVSWGLELMGLERLRKRSPRHLSGGEKKRLAIASILAMRPRMLVLDEPASSLDARGRRELLIALRELRKSYPVTLVLVEQDSAFIAEIADRVAVLNLGRLELLGTPQQAFADVDRMRTLGLSVPQLSQLADQLNRQFGTKFDFTTLDQAHGTLSAALDV